VEKATGIKNYLDEIKGMVDEGAGKGWFYSQGDELSALTKGLKKKLSLPTTAVGEGLTGMERQGMMLPFLESYYPRVFQQEMRAVDQFIGMLSKDKQAFYSHLRKGAKHSELHLTGDKMAAELGRGRRSLEQTIAARTHAQAREMYLFEGIKDFSSFANTLPLKWKRFHEHYMTRIMGLPSQADDYVASVLNLVPIGKSWDAFRVMSAAKRVNDFTYMGFLGLKPFSAMRNLFQPLLLVPADLGGTKDIFTLMKGFRFAASKRGKHLLDNIGVKGEYAPELPMANLRVFDVGRSVAGKRLPKWTGSLGALRDATLWAFRGSDNMNRYVSGGAAYVKWEEAFRKTFPTYSRGQIPKAGQIRTFMKKAGINGRAEPVKHRIENNLRAGHFEQGGTIFVKDVVADTQYLYGHADSPLFTQQLGGVGKTISIFQSWWMNYANTMGKWATTGTVGARFQRGFAWMVSHAMAYTMMRQMWDHGTASKSVFLGPISGLQGEVPTPPIWDAMRKTVGNAWKAGDLLARGDIAGVGKQALSTVKTTVPLMIPGGLQLSQSVRAGYKEGAFGVAKSIIRYNREPFGD